MLKINKFKETENFLASKLIGAQLDSFHVYSLELQLNFMHDSGGELHSYWLSTTENVIIVEEKIIYHERPEVIARLYTLIGQKISSVKIEDGGKLLLFYANNVITVSESDDSLEEVWSLTPNSPDPYEEHEWSVTYTDESELVLSQPE